MYLASQTMASFLIMRLFLFSFFSSKNKLPGPSIKSPRQLFSCTGAIDIVRFPSTDLFFLGFRCTRAHFLSTFVPANPACV